MTSIWRKRLCAVAVVVPAAVLTGACAKRPMGRVAETALEPTTPTFVRSTKEVPALGEKKLIVLSPASFRGADPQLTLEVPCCGHALPAGVRLSADYSEILSVAERAMLNRNWNPISQAALGRAARERNVAGSVRKMHESELLSPLEAAITLAPALDADAVFAFRAIEVEAVRVDPFEPGFVCNERVTYRARLEGTLVRGADGAILWVGEATVRTTDFLAHPALLRVDTGFDCVDVSPDVRNVTCEPDSPECRDLEVRLVRHGVEQLLGAVPIK